MSPLTPNDSPRPSRSRSIPVNGPLLRQLRISLGWSQSDVATLADVTDRLIRKAESGGPLQRRTIAALARVYQAPVEAIIVAPQPTVRSHSDPDAPSVRVASVPSAAARLTWFLESLWNNGRLDLIDVLMRPDFRFHNESGVTHTRNEMRARVLALRESFSDFDFRVQQAAEHDDFVGCRWEFTLTHTGEWLGLPATGRRVTVPGSSWVQIVEGQFGDGWDYWDPGQIYQQLAARDP